ncbi:MAG TPA: ATP-dependent metallopeptidase FtsH/Yme1/Tma family protein, partial [Actinomycetota bacterium]
MGAHELGNRRPPSSAKGALTKTQESPLRRILRGPAIYLLIVVAALWIFLSFATRAPQPEQLSLTRFEELIAQSNVKTAKFLEKDQKVVGTLQDGAHYETTYPSQYQDDLAHELTKAAVPITTDPQEGSFLSEYLPTIILFLLVMGGLYLLMNQMQGGGSRVMSFSKARAKVVSKDQP